MLMIDTDVLIWYLRGYEKARAVIEKQESFYISVVTYIEIVQGMRNKRELKLFRSALRNWNAGIAFINEEISSKAMFYVEQYYLSHSLELADSLIAATAVVNGFELLTGNVKHYKAVNGLDVKTFTP